jgi:hypothetical protein
VDAVSAAIDAKVAAAYEPLRPAVAALFARVALDSITRDELALHAVLLVGADAASEDGPLADQLAHGMPAYVPSARVGGALAVLVLRDGAVGLAASISKDLTGEQWAGWSAAVASCPPEQIPLGMVTAGGVGVVRVNLPAEAEARS